MRIPLLDLFAQFETISREVKERINEVVESQAYILGPEVEKAENNIAEYCGAKHGIGVASGTDALILALKALGVGPGDEVITPTFTFYATVSSIVHAGAKPVFTDIDPDDCLMTPGLVEDALSSKTKAVIPVHLFGQCADVPAIREAVGKDVSVLEDACQSIGAKIGNNFAGTMGDAGALSFYPSKNLGAFGDAGMVLTNRDDIADKIKLLRVHGAKKAYHHEYIGYNSRLDSIQAAVLNVKIKKLSGWSAKRKKHAAKYNEHFSGSLVRPLANRRGDGHVYNNYVVLVPDRDKLMERLKEREIGCGVYYPYPLHQMDCFSEFVGPGASFPVAEKICGECLAIPAYPEMTDEMVDEVAKTILDFYQ